MKKILFILIISTTQIFCNDVKVLKAFDFNLGEKFGELGFKENFIDSPEAYSPKTFYIKDDELRILDIFNDRISIFNMLGSPIGFISLNNYNYMFGHTIGGVNLIFIYDSYSGLGFFDLDGGMIFDLDNNKLTNEAQHELGVFQIDNNIFIYNNELQVYNIKGNKLSNVDAKIIIENNNSKELVFDNDTKIDNIAKTFAKNNNLLLDKKLLSPHFNDFRALSKRLYGNITENSKKINDDDYNKKYLIGFDGDSNSYWLSDHKYENKKSIIILSKYGNIIDFFETKFIKSRISISNDGDIYYLDISPNGIQLLKTERFW